MERTMDSIRYRAKYLDVIKHHISNNQNINSFDKILDQYKDKYFSMTDQELFDDVKDSLYSHMRDYINTYENGTYLNGEKIEDSVIIDNLKRLLKSKRVPYYTHFGLKSDEIIEKAKSLGIQYKEKKTYLNYIARYYGFSKYTRKYYGPGDYRYTEVYRIESAPNNINAFKQLLMDAEIKDMIKNKIQTLKNK